MKSKPLTAILKALVLLLSWLLFSPLLFVLDGRWKLLPKWLRVLLFILSPMMLIVFFLIVMIADDGFFEYIHRYRYTTPWAVKKITGVRFPNYRIVDHSSRPLWSHGPTEYTTTLEFKEIPDDGFYEALGRDNETIFEENDTMVYSFRSKYKYCTLYNAYFFEFWTYGRVDVEVKKGSKLFKVSMVEDPDDNRFFREE